MPHARSGIVPTRTKVIREAALEISGLFGLVAVTTGLFMASRPRAGVVLFAVTLVLTAFTLWHHMTDPLAISL